MEVDEEDILLVDVLRGLNCWFLEFDDDAVLPVDLLRGLRLPLVALIVKGSGSFSNHFVVSVAASVVGMSLLVVLALVIVSLVLEDVVLRIL